MNTRTEAYEFVFFVVFVVVCGVTQPITDALHITNWIVSDLVTLVVFALEIVAIEWAKRRVMGSAKSRYVAKVVLWSSIGVPAILFAYAWLAKVKLSEGVQLVIYLVVTAIAAAVVCALAASAARQVEPEST